MWNDSIKFPNGYDTTTDDDGFTKETPLFIEGIPANFLSAKRSDKTLANQRGYTADMVVEVMACNYDNQEILMDEKDGKVYEIKDTYQQLGKETIQLTCQRR